MPSHRKVKKINKINKECKDQPKTTDRNTKKNKRWKREFRLKIDAFTVFDIVSVERNFCEKDTRSSIKKSPLVFFSYLMVFIRFSFVQVIQISNIFQDYTHIFALLSSCYECNFVKLSVSSIYIFLTFKAFCCFGNHCNKILTHAICLVSRVFLSSFYLYLSFFLSCSLYFFLSFEQFVRKMWTHRDLYNKRKKEKRSERERKK